jgi:glycosyltransferase involved in cell wall biosynthesis
MIDSNTPFVSICIPVFNGENYLHESITSVLEQDYRNFELLVLDNCSTDSTSSIVSSIKDDRVRYIKNKENIGAINNFSKCVSEAKGEYFVLLPHDDILLPGALKDFSKTLDNKDIGLVYSAIQVIDENGDTLHKKINHKSDMAFTSENAVKDIVNNFMPIQLTMVRTDILKKLGGFDLQYSLFADVHLWLSVIFDGWGTYYLNTPRSCHRSHARQGQKAFLKPNLDILSEHWGRQLDKTFWEKNSYNYLQLKLSNFLFEGMKDRQYDTVYAKKIFIKIFVRHHMRHILLSLVSLNKFALFQEVQLLKPIISQYSLSQVILAYPSAILSEILIRLFYKNK